MTWLMGAFCSQKRGWAASVRTSVVAYVLRFSVVAYAPQSRSMAANARVQAGRMRADRGEVCRLQRTLDRRLSVEGGRPVRLSYRQTSRTGRPRSAARPRLAECLFQR